MEGKGFVHPNSPTSPTKEFPLSSNAYTEQPNDFDCISPSLTSESGLPITNAPAKSVPPDKGANQISDLTFWYIQLYPS